MDRDSVARKNERVGRVLRAVREEVSVLVAQGASAEEVAACVDHNVLLAQRCLAELVEEVLLAEGNERAPDGR